jgi:hypothetical protein
MATEKFFENGGRPIDTDKASAHFLNAKSEVDISSDIRNGSSSPLPTPASASQPKSKYKLTAAAIIPIWIVLSSSVIIYNNYLYNTLNFRYPVFLVTFHLGFAVRIPLLVPWHVNLIIATLIKQAAGTRILQRTTRLLDGAKDIHLTKDMFMRSILPIGLLFSGSLILSNTAYLYLSVAYIQMLKVCPPPFFFFFVFALMSMIV